MEYYIKSHNGNIPFKTFYLVGDKKILVIGKHETGELNFSTITNTRQKAYELTRSKEITDPVICKKLQQIYENYQQIDKLFKQL